MSLHSALYVGQVSHRRFAPVAHAFRYRLFMLYLDLAELDQVFRGRWLWSVNKANLAAFHRSDYLGPHDMSLDAAVRARVQHETGHRPAGPIRLLTHARYFGYCMNPVSFYYCWDRHDQRVDAIVAEINNTPWNERHCYVLDSRMTHGTAHRHRYRFTKTFHVSPFLGMKYDYDWRFTEPAQRLTVAMRNEHAGQCDFTASLALQRKPLSRLNLAGALARFPFMTGKVIGAIYWQALRLWWKGAVFYPHPQKNNPGSEV